MKFTGNAYDVYDDLEIEFNVEEVNDGVWGRVLLNDNCMVNDAAEDLMFELVNTIDCLQHGHESAYNLKAIIDAATQLAITCSLYAKVNDIKLNHHDDDFDA